MDDSLTWNYHSARAQKARVGSRLRGVPIQLLHVAVWVMALSGSTLLAFSMAFGWLIALSAVLPWMMIRWYEGELRHLPSGKSAAVDSLMSGDILGQLPQKPTPQDVAQAVGKVSSGQFMGIRFGLTPNVLSNLASNDPNAITQLWHEAETVRIAAGVEHYTGSVLVVALIRCYPDYERLIAQIHLDDKDLIEGVRWQQHIRDLVTKFQMPKRTGG
ncbi:ATP-dependent Clp protease ATP-binding subunit, partial [Candidatus Saccharibacteria bacterium]|nr:ATP-dependent Clp protease ATP-binding subunit [Candidatus Saccharibacteria bacterium]